MELGKDINFNNNLLIQFAYQSPANTYAVYNLPISYYARKDYVLVHGGGDANGKAFVQSEKVNESSIKIGCQYSSGGWGYGIIFYLTIGFLV